MTYQELFILVICICIWIIIWLANHCLKNWLVNCYHDLKTWEKEKSQFQLIGFIIWHIALLPFLYFYLITKSLQWCYNFIETWLADCYHDLKTWKKTQFIYVLAVIWSIKLLIQQIFLEYHNVMVRLVINQLYTS